MTHERLHLGGIPPIHREQTRRGSASQIVRNDIEVETIPDLGPDTVAPVRLAERAATRCGHNVRTDSGDVPFGEVASETFDDIVGNRNDATLVFTVASLHGPAGNPDDQRFLWGHLDDLRAAIGAQAARPLGDAVAEYVEAISGQHGDRLEALLARPGLGGQDPITDREMARRLGVSDERASQITRRLWHHRDRRRPPAGVWMPQIGEAERDGWPVEYTGAGMEATRGFVG